MFSLSSLKISHILVEISQKRGGLCYPTEGLRFPIFGLLIPIEGLCYPTEGLIFPTLGLPNPIEGLCYPTEGLSFPTLGLFNPISRIRCTFYRIGKTNSIFI